MRVNRTLLYAGIFLVSIGGVVAAADLGVVRESLLTDALRWWPLAVIAVGLGLVLRRTRVSLSGGMLGAAVPGLLLGSAFAVVPRISGFCGAIEEPTAVVTREGAFDGLASVSVQVDCGSVNVTTAPGSGWRLDARTTDNGFKPVVTASARSLAIASTSRDGWLGIAPDDWDLTLPTSDLDELLVIVNAGRADLDLADATIDRLSVNANAAEVVVDASTASITTLSGDANFGELSLTLPASDLAGHLEVDAGRIRICAPPELGLFIKADETMGDVSVEGSHLGQTNAYQSANYHSATHRADLEIHADFGAVEINPIGGCK
jgi:hypothetical protein